MMRRSLPVALIAATVASASCGYPSFEFGPGGTGGGTTTGPSTSSTSSTAAASSSGANTSSTSGSGGTTTGPSTSSTSSSGTTTSTSGGVHCGIGHLVISEIRSRGPGGASDEFIELYNPNETPAQLDSGWTIEGRSNSSFTYSQRWQGMGKWIPAHGHYLIVGGSYTQSPPGDDTLSQPITDAASLVLQLDGAPVSVVCYYYDATSLLVLQDGGYTCDEMPVENPHDDTMGTNTDASIERKPGGPAGNCTNSGNNAVDFTVSSPSTPFDTTSMLTPD